MCIPLSRFLLQRLVHFERKDRQANTSAASSAQKPNELTRKLTEMTPPTPSPHVAATGNKPPNVVVMVPKHRPSLAQQQQQQQHKAASHGAPPPTKKHAPLLHSALTQGITSRGSLPLPSAASSSSSLAGQTAAGSLSPSSYSSSSSSSDSSDEEADAFLRPGRRGERGLGRGGGGGGGGGKAAMGLDPPSAAESAQGWKQDGWASSSSVSSATGGGAASRSIRAKKGSKVRRLHSIPLKKDGE